MLQVSAEPAESVIKKFGRNTSSLNNHTRRPPATSRQIHSLINAVKLHLMALRWHVAGARRACGISYQKIQAQHLQRRLAMIRLEPAISMIQREPAISDVSA